LSSRKAAKLISLQSNALLSMSESYSKRLKLNILGVPCTSCIIPVRKALERTPGILKVGTNQLLDLLLIDYDPSKVDEESLIEIIRKTGYKAVRARNS